VLAHADAAQRGPAESVEGVGAFGGDGTRRAVKQRALVDEVAVVAEAFAVIGKQNHQRAVPPSAADQRLFEGRHELIDVGELRVTAELVRQVHVEEVDEGEDRLRAVISGQPLGGGVDDEGAGAGVEDLAGHGGEDAEVEGAVVEVKALIEAGVLFEEDCADERGGLIAVGLEDRGERDRAGRDGFEGSVRGAWESAEAKRVPWSAKESILGVCAWWQP
jgi:hypothetical protein